MVLKKGLIGLKDGTKLHLIWINNKVGKEYGMFEGR